MQIVCPQRIDTGTNPQGPIAIIQEPLSLGMGPLGESRGEPMGSSGGETWVNLLILKIAESRLVSFGRDELDLIRWNDSFPRRMRATSIAKAM